MCDGKKLRDDEDWMRKYDKIGKRSNVLCRVLSDLLFCPLFISADVLLIPLLSLHVTELQKSVLFFLKEADFHLFCSRQAGRVYNILRNIH